MTTSFKRTKLLVVGNSGAGKTSTIRSLLYKEFQVEYHSTEVADANVQVSLLSALDWIPQNKKVDTHLMEADLKQAVSQMNKDKAIETSGPISPVVLPALNPKVVEAISESSGIKGTSLNLKISSMLNIRKIMGRLQTKGRQQIAQLMARRSKSSTVDLSHLSSAEDKNVISFTIWDFGGQEVFYHLHHLFLTKNGVYLVVLNPVQLLKKEKQEIENLTFWTGALLIQAPEAPVAFVATRAGEINQEEVQAVDNILIDFCKDKKELNLMFNDREDLMFFPVENSLKGENEKYLTPLKAKIHQVVTDEETPHKHEVKQRIKLSWIYIMDSFVREAESHMLFNEMMFHCKRLGVFSDELENMLTFYTEVGTIVYFPPKNNERTALNEVAVLNPQWLLKALACYLYDRKIHKRKRFAQNKSFREMLARYEDTGILSRSLLDNLWRGYTKQEVSFLESLSSNMLLISKYVFEAEEVEGAAVDGEAYVVPAMLKDYEGEVLDLLPDQANSFNASIKFDGPMPAGLFERFVSEIVRKSGQFEGSESPRLYKNYADVGFGFNMGYSVLQRSTKTIRISTTQKDGENHMRRVISFVSRIVPGFDRILGEKFKPRILVEAYEENEIVVCELGNLWDVLKSERAKIVAVTLKGRKISVSTAAFSAFHPENPVAFDSVTSISSDKRLSTVLEDEYKDQRLICWAFLVHEWGTASSGHETHNKVLTIKAKLESKGINLWVQEDFADVYRLDELLTDAQLSRKLVIFLSRRYMERIMDPENNVAKQFSYWMAFFPKKDTIVAILDESLLILDTWIGPITQCNTEDVCHLDFSSTARMNNNLDRLIMTIRT